MSAMNWLKKALPLCAVFLFSAVIARAAVREAILYPNSAQISELSRIKLQAEGPQMRKAVFALPIQADPDSLNIRLADDHDGKIIDVKREKSSRVNSSEVERLKKRYEQLADEKNKVEASIAGQKAKIDFWQSQSKNHMRKVADAAEMAGTIGTHIQKLIQDKHASERKLEDISRQARDAEDKYRQATGGTDRSWEISVLLYGVRGDEVTLAYNYSLNQSGWSSHYRLEASPKESKIRFVWEAEISQSSALTWEGADVTLATMRPSSSDFPPDLPPWIIAPKSDRVKKAAPERAMMAAPAPAPMAAAENDESADPYMEQKSTFQTWKLGKKTILPGTKQRIVLMEEVWNAKFGYLARPGKTEKAFVMAKVVLPQAKEIPHGTGLYSIDGSIIGKRPFHAAGKEIEVFFGSDPMVTAKSKLISGQAGQKSIIDNKQTYAWDWEIELKNNRNTPIALKVEEPQPQAKDERIVLDVKSDPAVSEKKDGMLIWNMDLPASSEKKIKYKVKLEAPKNMNLNLGWRE